MLVNMFTVRREREADWRKLKLNCYQDFIGALSEVVGPQPNQQAYARYANAMNNLILVAPDAVISSCYRIQDEIDRGKQNGKRDVPQEFRLLLDALREIRSDVTPGTRKSSVSLRLFGYPSDYS
jgi:hypothetical protein